MGDKLISNDFVLIKGLEITNADIDEFYNIHMANKAKIKIVWLHLLWKN